MRSGVMVFVALLVGACRTTGAAATAAPTPTPAPASAAVAQPAQTAVAPSVGPAMTAAPTAVPAASAAGTSGGSGYGDGYGGYGGYGGGSGSGASSAAASAPAPAQPAGALRSTTVTGIGTILANPGGMTLYTYKPDSNGRSACNGGCAQAWPPLVATSLPQLPAGWKGTLTLITRDDGTKQVAYDGHPLYAYAGDSAPGDANGQGIGGIWFVVTK